jgi:hypothetical protein
LAFLAELSAEAAKHERLVEARALAAISLQVRQSLWGSHSSDPLDHHGTPIQSDGEKR